MPHDMFVGTYPAGQIKATLLGDERAAATFAMAHLLELLLGWSNEDEVPSLDKISSFYVDFQRQISSETVQSLKPGWLPHAAAALSCFEGHFSKTGEAWSKSTWKSSGPDEIATMLESCKHLPSNLQSVLQLAKSASIFDKLEPFAQKEFEDFDKELAPFLKVVKKWITLCSFDKDCLQEYLLEETLQRADDFVDSVEGALTTFFKQTEAEYKVVLPLVEKYK